MDGKTPDSSCRVRRISHFVGAKCAARRTTPGRRTFSARRIIVALLLLLPTALCLHAASEDGGGAGSYLRLGVGARSQAMGGAFSAVADDPQAAFWNPAGLTEFKGINIYSQLALLAYGRKHSFLNYCHAATEDVTVAFSWLSFSGGDDLERRVGPSFEPLSYFSDSQNCYLLSTGYRFHPHVSIGMSSKVLTHRLDEQFGWGFGFDAGVLCTYEGYRGALVLRDAGSRINWRNAYQETFPFTICLGGAVRVRPDVLFSLEMTKTSEQEVKPHCGMEVIVARELSLQVGYDRDIFCGGVTIRVLSDWADYHLGYVIGEERMIGASLSHRVAFRMKFNAFDYYMWK